MSSTISPPQGVMTFAGVVWQTSVTDDDAKDVIGAGKSRDVPFRAQVGGNSILLSSPVPRPDGPRYVTDSCIGYREDSLPQPVGVSTTKSDGLVTVAYRGKVPVIVNGEPGQRFKAGDLLRVTHPTPLMQKSGIFHPRLIVDGPNQSNMDIFHTMSAGINKWIQSNPDMEKMVQQLTSSHYDYDALGLNKNAPNDHLLTKLTAEFIRYQMISNLNFLAALLEKGVCTLERVTATTESKAIRESFAFFDQIKNGQLTDSNEKDAVSKAMIAHLSDACKNTPPTTKAIDVKDILQGRFGSAANDKESARIQSGTMFSSVSSIQRMAGLLDEIRARKDRTILGTAEDDLTIPTYQHGHTKEPYTLMVNLHPGKSNVSA